MGLLMDPHTVQIADYMPGTQSHPTPASRMLTLRTLRENRLNAVQLVLPQIMPITAWVTALDH